MSELEQNIPDDFWRKAFEEAAETPPLRVWDAVERRLDEGDKPKILPLWGAGFMSSRPLVWGTGMAAAIALVLIGWWVVRTIPADESRSVAQHFPATTQSVPAAPSKAAETTAGPRAEEVASSPRATGSNQPDEHVAVSSKPVQTTNKQPKITPAQPRIAIASTTRQRDAMATQSTSVGDEPPMARVLAASNQADQQNQTTSFSAGKRSGIRIAAADKAGAPAETSVSLTVLDQQATTAFAAGQSPSYNELSARALRLKSAGTIQRIVWFRPAEPALEPELGQPKRVAREAWASLSMMPGAFNPTVAVRSAQASFTKTTALSNSSASQPAIASRANFSVAYQAGAGFQLSERWSVESGVGYLAGRSTVDSPVQQTSVYGLQAASPLPNTRDATLYVDALRTSLTNALPVASNALVSNDFNNAATSRYAIQGNYNPQVRQTIANDYQFVQVPVQIGFQLRPRKRLGMALIGGFLSNIFVRNTVGDELVVTAKDGIYKPVSLAASLGARFRYRPSKQWSASLAGMYQPSLGFGTRPESVVQSRPTSTGMSFGVDYHF